MAICAYSFPVAPSVGVANGMATQGPSLTRRRPRPRLSPRLHGAPWQGERARVPLPSHLAARRASGSSILTAAAAAPEREGRPCAPATIPRSLHALSSPLLLPSLSDPPFNRSLCQSVLVRGECRIEVQSGPNSDRPTELRVEWPTLRPSDRATKRQPQLSSMNNYRRGRERVCRGRSDG